MEKTPPATEWLQFLTKNLRSKLLVGQTRPHFCCFKKTTNLFCSFQNAHHFAWTKRDGARGWNFGSTKWLTTFHRPGHT
jgi:hypothetical protein